MKKTITIAVFAAILFACSSEGDKGNHDSQAVASKVDGEKIYKTYCVTCHGIAGDMGASGAFNLRTSQLPLEERIKVVTNGRNAMTPFKDLLNEEKIHAVAAYVETLRE